MTENRPRRQRRLALAVLLGAAALAVVSFSFRGVWWGGWILAIAEAGIVGGLADWFAVTALFRRPLGLPIPHTALIPANWELMARRVGTMVGSRVLTKEYVQQEVERIDVADLLARGAERISARDLATATRMLARWLVGQLSREALVEVGEHGRRALARQPLAPLLARGLEVARGHGWDQRVLGAVTGALVQALERPAFRATVEELLDELLARYRARLGLYPRLWIGLAHLLGLIDRERAVAALHAGLGRMAGDPEHPLRVRLCEAAADLAQRLRSDPALAARVDAALREALETPVVTRAIADAAAGLHRFLVADVTRADSEMVEWVAARLESGRQALITDAALRRDLDRWAKAKVGEAVERYHDRIAAFIENGVRALGPEGAVRLIEEHAGDDLQYIRVNGTVVGGLAGGVLYGIHLLLRLL